ncbi:MAG: DUF192 domain-containing protein [Spirochaetales bacterium]|nr:DUF192 domain-containing protein [Spirochaetales bacterium]
MKKILSPLILLILTFSCSTKSAHGLEEALMTIKGHDITVELARTNEERQTGLMHRESLDEDRGMLFIFDDERTRSFWMKNTLIPLSIAYIDRDGVIVDIRDMEPLDTSSVPSAAPAMYALEVNQGKFREWGVRPGYRLVLPEEVR